MKKIENSINILLKSLNAPYENFKKTKISDWTDEIFININNVEKSIIFNQMLPTEIKDRLLLITRNAKISLEQIVKELYSGDMPEIENRMLQKKIKNIKNNIKGNINCIMIILEIEIKEKDI